MEQITKLGFNAEEATLVIKTTIENKPCYNFYENIVNNKEDKLQKIQQTIRQLESLK